MKTLLLLFLIMIAFVLRWWRWLAWIQQKEYRADRLWLFLQSKEGRAELRHFLPRRGQWQRAFLKRPRWTARVLLVAFLSIIFSLMFASGLFFLIWLGVGQFVSRVEWWMLILISVTVVISLYLILPVLIILATGPTSLLVAVNIRLRLRAARLLLIRAKPLVIGITGSYGKTATKQLLASLLGQRFSVFATPKSHNTPLSVASAILHGYHRQAIALIEFAAYKEGEITQLATLFPPQQVMITGLSPQHLGLFGSLDAIIRAKAELIEAMVDEGVIWYSQNNPDVKLIVDAGLSERRRQGQTTTQLQIRQYATPTQWRELHPRLTDEGRLVVNLAEQIVHTQLIGLHYVEAISGSLEVAQSLGVPLVELAERLRQFTPTENFTRAFHHSTGAYVIDDGGSTNPAGFAASLRLAEAIEAKRKILVTAGIVDLGEMSESVHRALAEQARLIFDEVYYLGVAGRAEFETAFGHACLVEREAILASLARVKPQMMLLLEGRLPAWFQEELK